jgi:hypothetical protein
MPTTRRILEPESDLGRLLASRWCRPSPNPLFFDDLRAVMYSKIDTTPVFATSPTDHGRAETEAGTPAGRPSRVAEIDRRFHAFSLIPSRMTHRPLLPSAGAPSERMKP